MTMTRNASHPPLVGIATCYRWHDASIPYHKVHTSYIRALSHGAEVIPILIPAIGNRLEIDTLLTRLDGLMFPGSSSNIEPGHYHGQSSVSGTFHDLHRDATTLPLIRAAVERGIPLLGICRGMQEINVALGGTLLQRLHEIPGYLEHQADEHQPVEIQYRPVHTVELGSQSILASLAEADSLMVNSLHEQGIDRLAERLIVEAVAPDGLIEAVRIRNASYCAIGLQWHPEWQFWEYSFNRNLFRHFGQAVRDYALDRSV